MPRYIDADKLKESLKELKAEGNNQKYIQGLQDAIDGYFPQIIDDEPTADVQPVKHGRWIYGENDDGQDGIFCSECEHFVPWFYEYYDKSDDLINDNPRCPNCGCKQDLEGGDING